MGQEVKMYHYLPTDQIGVDGQPNSKFGRPYCSAFRTPAVCQTPPICQEVAYLIERLISLLSSTVLGSSLAANGVNLVNENNGGGLQTRESESATQRPKATDIASLS